MLVRKKRGDVWAHFYYTEAEKNECIAGKEYNTLEETY